MEALGSLAGRPSLGRYPNMWTSMQVISISSSAQMAGELIFCHQCPFHRGPGFLSRMCCGIFGSKKLQYTIEKMRDMNNKDANHGDLSVDFS